jgi:hypothetical protein
MELGISGFDCKLYLNLVPGPKTSAADSCSADSSAFIGQHASANSYAASSGRAFASSAAALLFFRLRVEQLPVTFVLCAYGLAQSVVIRQHSFAGAKQSGSYSVPQSGQRAHHRSAELRLHHASLGRPAAAWNRCHKFHQRPGTSSLQHARCSASSAALSIIHGEHI